MGRESNPWRELYDDLAEISGRADVFERLPDTDTKTEVKAIWDRMEKLITKEKTDE